MAVIPSPTTLVSLKHTLLLDTASWDLVLDVNGNIAVAKDPYSLAQDAASAIKTFQGEVYYDTNLGVPYWDQILGHSPPLSYIKAQLEKAALTVPGAVTARAFISSFIGRIVAGQVQLTDVAGRVVAANF